MSTRISPEQKRMALEQALASRTFARSEQLKNFLRFVCEAEMEGRDLDLREYVIGIEVLGRPEGYSPAEDSAVRARAYELRQKLAKFYALEAPDSPLRIEIPKGNYTPQYVVHGESPPQEAVETSDAGAPPPAPAPGISRKAVVLALAAAFLAGILVSAAFLRGSRTSPWIDPVLAEAWGPLLRPDGNVLLAVATPLHFLVGPATHVKKDKPSFPLPAELYAVFREHRPLQPGDRLAMGMTDNSVAVGGLFAVVTTSNTLKAASVPHQILPERVATLSTLRGRNAMLFGAPVDSEAITRLMEPAPLSVTYDEGMREFTVRDRRTGRNLNPKRAENGDFSEVYGLLTVIRNRTSEAGDQATVLFAGITSVGTHGAAEFFSSPRLMRDLRARFVRDGYAGFPSAYQVVVRCTVNRTILVSYEYHSNVVFRP